MTNHQILEEREEVNMLLFLFVNDLLINNNEGHKCHHGSCSISRCSIDLLTRSEKNVCFDFEFFKIKSEVTTHLKF